MVTWLEVLDRLAGRTPDELYLVARNWIPRYLPIWYAAFEHVAPVLRLTPEKQAAHVAAMDSLVEQCDAWRGGAKVVKARVREHESALSQTGHWGVVHFPGHPGAIRARKHMKVTEKLLWMAASHWPHVHHDRADLLGVQLFSWAELESGFTSDTEVLWGWHALRARDAGDTYERLYLPPAELGGSQPGGPAVLDAARFILDHLDEPQPPYQVPADFWPPYEPPNRD